MSCSRRRSQQECCAGGVAGTLSDIALEDYRWSSGCGNSAESETGSRIAGNDHASAAGLTKTVCDWAGLALLDQHGGGEDGHHPGGVVEAHGFAVGLC
jgi:hypothetical protein